MRREMRWKDREDRKNVSGSANPQQGQRSIIQALFLGQQGGNQIRLSSGDQRQTLLSLVSLVESPIVVHQALDGAGVPPLQVSPTILSPLNEVLVS